MESEDKKLRCQILKFLATTKGEQITTLAGLAGHFGMTLTEMLTRVHVAPEIHNLVEINKANLKEKMRKVWRNGNKPNLQLSAYRLMADEDELIRLSGDSPQSHQLERKDPLLEVLNPKEIWK